MLGRYGTSVADAREAHRRLPPGDSMIGRGRAGTAPLPDRPGRWLTSRLGCHRRRLEADGPRLHRRVQPAREHPLPATAGTVVRHHLPTQPLSSRDCAACRRSAPPLRGWQRPPQTPSRRPRSQLLCPCYRPVGRDRPHGRTLGGPSHPWETLTGTSRRIRLPTGPATSRRRGSCLWAPWGQSSMVPRLSH